MYGKFFASTFTGSMLGAGADVFAVWGYAIASCIDGQVELNPNLLAPLIGMTPERVATAIAYLAAPDPNSRSKSDEGRRLIQEGQFAYRVPNHAFYRGIRNEEERREYNRTKQAESRQRKKPSHRVKAPVIDKNGLSTMSAQAEADTYTETEATSTTSPASAKLASVMGVLGVEGQSWELMLTGMLEGLGTPGMKALPVETLYEAATELAASGGEVTPHRYKAFVRKVAGRVAAEGDNGSTGQLGGKAGYFRGRPSPMERSIAESAKLFEGLPE